ncbi:MAG: peptidylprolyl isomerase [Rickettsiales bacterium]|jgi:peptidyl-prolyl cis-trans isomerase C|nr:peptidylprolyl isomerase [Rickettsiales bacterium]
MKRSWLVFGSVFVAAIGVIFFLVTFRMLETYKQSIVFATSKKGDVTVEDVKRYIRHFEKTFGKVVNMADLKKEEKKVLAGEIINNRIIMERAKASGVLRSRDYLERRDNLIRGIFLENLIEKNISDDMIKSKYDELVKERTGKKEYELSHILVKTEADIHKVQEELKNRPFADVARELSIDNSRENGGALGWVIDGNFEKEFDEVIKNQQINVISKPFKTSFGWHVVLKKGVRNAVIPEFENAKNILRDILVREFLRDYEAKNIEDLDIKVVEE